MNSARTLLQLFPKFGDGRRKDAGESHAIAPSTKPMKLHRAPFAMALDDLWLAIGSANLDHRSFRINDEVVANFRDAQIASAHHQIFERDLEASQRLTWEEFQRRPWHIKLADQHGRDVPVASLGCRENPFVRLGTPFAYLCSSLALNQDRTTAVCSDAA